MYLDFRVKIADIEGKTYLQKNTSAAFCGAFYVIRSFQRNS